MDKPIIVQKGDKLGFTTETNLGGIAYSSDPFHIGAFSRALSIAMDGCRYPDIGNNYHFTGDFFDKKFSIAIEVDRDLSQLPVAVVHKALANLNRDSGLCCKCTYSILPDLHCRILCVV